MRQLTALSLLSLAHADSSLFDVGVQTFSTQSGNAGDSRVHFLYPTLSDGARQTRSAVDIEYLFKDISTSGYDLAIDAATDAPIAPGKYPMIVYLHGKNGFSLDAHTFLTRWASEGFIVFAADQPGYEIGDDVYASEVQQHTGKLVANLYHSCPPGAESLCDAVDFDHLAAAGPGVEDPLCQLDGWSRLGLHATVQVQMDGDVIPSERCVPIEGYTQDAAFVATGPHLQFVDEVSRLKSTTATDRQLKAYFLGLPSVSQSALALTDICDMLYQFRSLKHLSPSITKECATKVDEVEDLREISRTVTADVFFHHLWNHPLPSPAERYSPERHPGYVYRRLEDGSVVDAVGSLDAKTPGDPLIPVPDADSYPFRSATIFTLLPLVLIAGVYMTCGCGMCRADYRQAKTENKSTGGSRCGVVKAALNRIVPSRARRGHRFKPEEDNRRSTDTESVTDSHATSRLSAAASIVDFLTAKRKTPSPEGGGLTAKQLRHFEDGNPYAHLQDLEEPTPRAPPGTPPVGRPLMGDRQLRAVELQPTKPLANPQTQPLLETYHPPPTKKKPSGKGYRPPQPPKTLSTKELEAYAALGSESETEVKPPTDAELHKLLEL